MRKDEVIKDAAAVEREEAALLEAVRGLPVPDPGPRFWESLPASVAAEIAAREGAVRRPLWRNPWAWGGLGTAAAAAAVLALWLVPAALRGPGAAATDAELILAVNAFPISLGMDANLALAGEDMTGNEWSPGMDAFTEEELRILEEMDLPAPDGDGVRRWIGEEETWT